MRWPERPAGRSIRYTRALLRYHGSEVIKRIAAPALTMAAWAVLTSFALSQGSLPLFFAVAVVAFGLDAWLAVTVHRVALTPERIDGARPDQATLHYIGAALLIGVVALIIYLPFRVASEFGIEGAFPGDGALTVMLRIIMNLAAALLFALLACRVLGGALLQLPSIAIGEPLSFARARELARPWELDFCVLLFVIPASFGMIQTLIGMIPPVPGVSLVLGIALELIFTTISVLLLSYLYRAIAEREAAAAEVATAITNAQAEARRDDDRPEHPGIPPGERGSED